MSSTGKKMQWEKSKSRNACSGFVPQAEFFLLNYNSDVNVFVQATAITVEVLFKFLIAISK